jgi:hypothetical protein
MDGVGVGLGGNGVEVGGDGVALEGIGVKEDNGVVGLGGTSVRVGSPLMANAVCVTSKGSGPPPG